MSLAKSLENTLLTIGNTTVSKEPEESVAEASLIKNDAWFSYN